MCRIAERIEIEIRDVRLVLGAVPEVARDRSTDGVLALVQPPLELLERLDARLIVGRALRACGLPHATEHAVRVLRAGGLLGLFGVGDCGGHGSLLGVGG